YDLGIRLRGMHDLDERHLRHGIEEMQADETFRPRQPCGKRLELQTRGVRGQPRLRLHPRLEAAVQASLGVEILEDGFDDDVGTTDAGTFDVGCQALAHGVARSRIAYPPIEELLSALQGRLDQL